MNLAMQTRRAMITLGLVVAAMLCVAAKTASTADLHASMPTNIAAPKTDSRIGAVTQGRIVLVSTYAQIAQTRPHRHAEHERLSRADACGIIAACCMSSFINRKFRRTPAM